MSNEQRQSAIDNTRERLEVLLALARHTGYPLNLEQKAIDIVDAVIGLTKERPMRFPWPSAVSARLDAAIERLR